MMQNRAMIIGIKVITTKMGKTGYEYHFQTAFSDYDKEHSQCYGSQVITEYSPIAFNVKVGDEVAIYYGKGYQGRAQLVDIVPLQETAKAAK